MQARYRAKIKKFDLARRIVNTLIPGDHLLLAYSAPSDMEDLQAWHPSGEREMRRVTIGTLATLAFATSAAAQSDYSEILNRISLPDGFRISVFAEVPGARSIVRDPASGVIFIGSRSDTIHALADKDGDGTAETVTEIATGLHVPNGLAIQDGKLFIALQDDIELIFAITQLFGNHCVAPIFGDILQ